MPFSGGKKPVRKPRRPVIVTRPTPVDRVYNMTRLGSGRLRKSEVAPAGASVVLRRGK